MNTPYPVLVFRSADFATLQSTRLITHLVFEQIALLRLAVLHELGQILRVGIRVLALRNYFARCCYHEEIVHVPLNLDQHWQPPHFPLCQIR